MDAKDEGEPLGSTGLGTFGPIQISPDQIDYIDKIGKKSCQCFSMAPGLQVVKDIASHDHRMMTVTKSLVGIFTIHFVECHKPNNVNSDPIMWLAAL